MGRAEDLLGRLVTLNNRWISQTPALPNPRPVAELGWNRELESRHGDIALEWSRFQRSGRRVPAISDLLSEDQGNEGDWDVGLLISKGRPVSPLADRFPATIAALRGVPGLRSALFSVLGAGAHLPPHHGPNAGMLRYHLGISCGEDAALRVEDHVEPYRDGHGLLFDDTAEHEAWNRGDQPRVTLFCELYRPLKGRRWLLNRVTQQVIGLDPRYRRAPARAKDLDAALNANVGADGSPPRR